MAHAYGALFRIPHGLANAVFLPHVLELVPDLYTGKIDQLAQALNLETKDQSTAELLTAIVAKIRNLQEEVGLPKDFLDFDIPGDSLELTIQAAHSDPAAMNFPLPAELITEIGRRVASLQVPQAT